MNATKDLRKTLTRAFENSAKTRAAALAAAAALTVAAAGCGGDDPAGATETGGGNDPAVASETGGGASVLIRQSEKLASVVIETGGPIEPNELDLVTEFLYISLKDGWRIEVTLLDGPNAATAKTLDLPWITASGVLDTDAGNSSARSHDLDEALPEIEEALITALSGGDPNLDLDLDSGRDLIGAIDRAAASNPAALLILTTSGGVHRTSTEDFLQEIGTPHPIEMPDGSVVRFMGVADVPVADGKTPAKALTDGLYDYFLETCRLTEGSSSDTVCDVG